MKAIGIILALLISLAIALNQETGKETNRNGTNIEYIKPKRKEKLNKGFGIEIDEIEFDKELLLIIKEHHLENKGELTKSDVETILKHFIQKQSEEINAQDTPGFLMDSVNKMFEQLQKEILDTIPERIKYEELNEYITLERISDMFETLMSDVNAHIVEMAEDYSGIGDDAIIENVVNNNHQETEDDL